MNVAYGALQKELGDFMQMKLELHELEETVEHEILHIDRFVKNVVMDMADTVDSINDNVNEQEKSISIMKKILIDQNNTL